ncbi:Mucin-associated surface protein (MASP) subgroup S074 [Trypanosoma cruzi]|uniref:Mucin-associated surface protein (MASP) subgroup S074 n=1 Tax=Trypanosoma cruzi TaxID=5693 RepID=A0A7J6XPL7_TRYCR|nr:Mucin-associated surface protein (MASP) subgroup S074 [Trypanosoma cruzi]
MHYTHTIFYVDACLLVDACTMAPYCAAPFIKVFCCFFTCVFNCCVFLFFLLISYCGALCVFLPFIGLMFLMKCVLLLLMFFTVPCLLFLLLLCVDGMLVCAEGYTQVTGVMAMMMSGRVLLVCALCVLWCVTVFGIARDNRCIEGDGNVLTRTHNGGNNGLRLKADCGLISTRMGLINAVAAGDGSEGGTSNAPLDSVGGTSPGSLLAGSGGNETPAAGGEQSAAGAATPPSPSGPGVSGAGDEGGQLPVAGQEENEKNKVDPNSNAAAGPPDQTNDQLSSSSGSTPTRSGENPSSIGTDDLTPLSKDTETEGDADRQDNRESNEAIEEEDGNKDKEKKQEKNTLQPETQEGQNNGGGTPPPPVPAPLPPTTPSGGPAPSSTAETENLKNENTPSEFETDSEATQPPSGDTTQEQHSHDTDKEDPTKNAATGSPAEPTTASSTSTSGSGDHVQNKADKDDAQSSEGQHDSLETGNTNVVPTLSEAAPQTAETITAAQTNGTATPDDSDSSTAVSHTTSPLLPLLVACAAAAAVVTA